MEVDGGGTILPAMLHTPTLLPAAAITAPVSCVNAGVKGAAAEAEGTAIATEEEAEAEAEAGDGGGMMGVAVESEKPAEEAEAGGGGGSAEVEEEEGVAGAKRRAERGVRGVVGTDSAVGVAGDAVAVEGGERRANS
jgi:hypothetical protein